MSFLSPVFLRETEKGGSMVVHGIAYCFLLCPWELCWLLQEVRALMPNFCCWSWRSWVRLCREAPRDGKSVPALHRQRGQDSRLLLISSASAKSSQDLIILTGPLQLEILHDSMILWYIFPNYLLWLVCSFTKCNQENTFINCFPTSQLYQTTSSIWKLVE